MVKNISLLEEFFSIRRFWYVYILFCLTGLVSSRAYSSEPQVLRFHPNCEPEVIDSPRVRRNLRLKNRQVPADSKINAMAKIIEALKADAIKKNADAILITNKVSKHPIIARSGKINKRKFILEVSADLLRLCEDDKSLSSRHTKYDETGALQHAQAIILSKEETIVLRETKEEPQVVSLKSNVVSPTMGVYGLTLSSSLAETESLFGKPSFRFTSNENTTTLSYGRGHWLYYEDGELVKVNTKTSLFTYELINQIPFSNDFDELIWAVNDELQKGTKKDNGDELGSYSANLTLVWSDYSNETQELVGFELKSTESADLHMDVGGESKSYHYDWLVNLVKTEISADELIEKAVGEILMSNDNKRYIHDQYLTFDVNRGRLSGIAMGDSLFNSKEKPKPWKYDNFYQNQPLEEVRSLLADSYIEVGDELHVDYDSYTMIFHAYDGFLYKLELKFY